MIRHILEIFPHGGFPSAAYFRLQAANTYLADFHPSSFALIDLTAYHSLYLDKRHLKDEISECFPNSHAFLYREIVFLFLHGMSDFDGLSALAEEFRLKVILSEELSDLFELPALYQTAREALDLMMDDRFHGGNVCTVAQLRTALLQGSGEATGSDLSGGAAARCLRPEKGYAVLQNALLLPHMQPFAEENLRCTFHPPQHRALPHPKNAEGFFHSAGRAASVRRSSLERIHDFISAERSGLLLHSPNMKLGAEHVEKGFFRAPKRNVLGSRLKELQRTEKHFLRRTHPPEKMAKTLFAPAGANSARLF